MDHLLAGDGGDEIFGGNSRYVRQQVFEVYRRIPGVVRSALLEPLAAALDPEKALWPLRKMSSYVRQARVPLPERFESWNLIYREGPGNVFDPRFLESVDVTHPLRRMREFWEECPSHDLLDRMLWYDWKLTLADNDLRKVSRMCELAGVRVSYPMLDEEVVDLSIRVPSNAKIVGNELRTFFKNAARGLLPEEIIQKQKHGFGLPFGVWLKTHEPLQKLVYNALESLRARDIVNRGFIDRLVTEHRSGHAGYYGYAIWDFVMLERWLQLQPSNML
jgi:asparagine synthase (glutamine-hydrolysing)